ncbi:MAG: hypothetical protein WCR02_07595 [Sphaerochaetaceae bacterium]
MRHYRILDVIILLACCIPLFASQGLSLWSGYCETSTNLQCSSFSLEWQDRGFQVGYRLFYPQNSLALGYTGKIGRNFIYQAKAHTTIYGQEGLTSGLEATIGLHSHKEHWELGFLAGAQGEMANLASTSSPLTNLVFAFHGWVRAFLGRASVALLYDSSTLFWYSYESLVPFVTLEGNYMVLDHFGLGVQLRMRYADLAPNEKFHITMVEGLVGGLWKIK